MDVFKTKVGSLDHIPITKENFEEATGRKPPYLAARGHGKESYFAVCPECDNPIQLVALYKADSVVNPYGRHHKGSIPDLAEYDPNGYLNCPYSNPDWSSSTVRRSPGSKQGAALRRLMKDQFDRIVYIWNQTAPLYMSKKLAEEELRRWQANEGWRNYNASYGNLAYNLLYARQAISIIYRWIRTDSKVYEALRDLPDIELETINAAYAKIVPKKGRFVDLSAFLGFHKPKTDDSDHEETFTFVVNHGDDTICEEEIVVRQDFLENLIHAGNEDKRNQELLDIADKVLG